MRPDGGLLNMKEDTVETSGASTECEVGTNKSETGPENDAKAASGSPTAFQEKMDRWTDRVGYGAYRGLICGLFSAWGYAAVRVVFEIVQVVLTHSFGKQDTGTLGECLVNIFFFVIGLSIFFAPVGVIVGAFLGAAGIVRKKKRLPEPPLSASKP